MVDFVNGCRRVLGGAVRLIADDRYSSKITSTIRAQGRMAQNAGHSRFYQFHKQVGEGFLRAEKITKNKSPWAGIVDSFRGLTKDVSGLWKGTEKGFFGKIGGTFKALGKRVPLLGTALMVAFEIPNIFRATKDEGLISGVKEAGKAGARLAAGIGLGAVGTAIGGPIGGIIGFFVGDLLGKLVVGKSYSEKKAAQEKELAEAQAAGQQVAFTGGQQVPEAVQGAVTNPVQSQQNAAMLQQAFSQNSLNDDFMVKSHGGNLNFLA